MSGKVVPSRNTAAGRRRCRRLPHRAAHQPTPGILQLVAGLHVDATHAARALTGEEQRAARLQGALRRAPGVLRRPVLNRQGTAPRVRPPAGQGTPARMDGVQPTSTCREGTRGYLARDVHRPGRLLRNGVRRHARIRPRCRDGCRAGRRPRGYGGPAAECGEGVGVRPARN